MTEEEQLEVIIKSFEPNSNWSWYKKIKYFINSKFCAIKLWFYINFSLPKKLKLIENVTKYKHISANSPSEVLLLIQHSEIFNKSREEILKENNDYYFSKLEREKIAKDEMRKWLDTGHAISAVIEEMKNKNGN